jgi:hypothetical protein
VAFAEQHRRALATALTLGDSAGPIRGVAGGGAGLAGGRQVRAKDAERIVS